MNTGYVPLFGSLTTGTLCGRWPDVGLWPIVLSLSDRHGVVDVTPAYIANVTGLAVEDVVACMARFCAPDPLSRSGAEGGARLVLLDAHRDWGWRIVNHAVYRERARKQMQQIEFTASGRDAERKRLLRERKASSDVQRCPAVSGSVRPSDSDSDKDSKTGLNGRASVVKANRKPAKTSIPEDFDLDPELEQYIADHLPDADPRALMDSYRRKALAKGWAYANWRQAFQEFVRNASPNSGHFAAGQYPRKPEAELRWQ